MRRHDVTKAEPNRDSPRCGDRREWGNGLDEGLHLVGARPLWFHAQIPAPCLLNIAPDQRDHLQGDNQITHAVGVLRVKHGAGSVFLPPVVTFRVPEHCVWTCVGSCLVPHSLQSHALIPTMLDKANGVRAVGDEVHELVAVLAHAIRAAGGLSLIHI